MPEFEPRNLFPVVKNPGENYPLYTVKTRNRGCLVIGLNSLLGSEYAVFGITHPYSAMHITNGYCPLPFITENLDEAKEKVKEYKAIEAHPIVVVLLGIMDRDLIQKRKKWTQENKTSFWSHWR